MNFHKIVDAIESNIPKDKERSYIGDDGLKYCAKCKTPLQARITVFESERVVSCICNCMMEAKIRKREAAEREELRKKIERYRRTGFPDQDMQKMTFEQDDMSNPQLTNAMRNYVDHFHELKKTGRGLLLYGPVGSGKTFAACEVANALIDKGYPCLVTNFARLNNTLQGMFEGRQAYIDSLNQFDLMVIDDLAAERDSEYMQEQVFNIVDGRYRAGLPMIFTTNLTTAQLKNPDNIQKNRIYDRILERCYPIKVEGENKRYKKLRSSFGEMKELLEI